MLLTALLLVLCVGAAELAFCYFAAPQLYARLTGPVVELARSSRAQLGLWWDDLTQALAEPPEEPQIAGGPAIEGDQAIADPTITEFLTVDGTEYLTGGSVTMVYYNQGDEAWGDKLYGRDPIAQYGCGPTAMSMAVSSLTEYASDPADMAAWAAEAGYCAPKSGSYLSIVQGTAEAWGLRCVPLRSPTADALLRELAAGGVVVALMGPGHFTKSGHFILLRGATLAGELLVADPNSRDNSLTLWDPQLILDELSPSTAHGAPLWLITPAGGD